MSATNILLIIMVIPLALFVYYYGKYSPWLSTIQGRTLMMQKVAWILLILHFLAESLWEYPGHDIVQTLLLVLLAILFWTMFIGLRMGQTALRPVSKKQGAGYVENEDLEKTRPRPPKRVSGR